MLKKLFRQSFLFLLIVFLQPAFASSQQTAAEELAQRLTSFSTLQAHFSQVTTDAQNQLIQKSSGTVLLERPGRFRWETKNPIHQTVITDGNTLWIYDADLKQATKQSIHHFPASPAKLLSGDVMALVKQFTVHMTSRNHMLVFQLIPKKVSPQFRSITISFKNDELQSMEIQNSLEQTNTFHFSNVTVNKSLPSSLFQFTPPAGVDVMQ